MFAHRFAIAVGVVLAGTIGMAGCSSKKGFGDGAKTKQDQDNKSASVASTQPASPMLSIRSGSGISLFGDVATPRGVPFAAQGARGMQQHTFTLQGGDFDPEIDATGQLLVFASTRHSPRPDIYVKSVGGSAVTQITDDPASDVQPQLSPDSKWIAFASNRSGNWDIWIVTIDGQQLQQITKTPMDEVHPTWSPDGKRLAYCALNERTGLWELWVAQTQRPGVARFIGHGLFPEWSPTDDVIAFQRARVQGNRLFSIWTIRLVDDEPRFPTEIASAPDQALISPAWTLDGKRVVYCAIRAEPLPGEPATGTTGEVWMTNLNGKGKVRLTRGDSASYSPTCGPSDRIYFASNRSGAENIWSVVPVTPPAPVADARSSNDDSSAAAQ